MNLGLYLTFIFVGLILFALVYLFSVKEQKKKRKSADEKIDALVDHKPVTSGFDGTTKANTAFDPNSNDSAKVDLPDDGGQSFISPEIRPAVSASDNRANSSRRKQAVAADANGIKANEDKTKPVDGLLKSDEVIESESVVSAQADPLVGSGAEYGIELPDMTKPYVGDALEQPKKLVKPLAEPQLSDLDDAVVDDSLGNLDSARTEPTFDSTPLSQQTESREQTFNAEDVNKSRAVEKTNELVSELVAKLPGDTALSRDSILIIFRKYDYLLARKMQVFGVNSLTNAWSDVELENDSASFLDVGVSVQLADKTGALTRKELNAMSQMVLELSETFDRRFNFSMDLDDAIECGRRLDDLARTHCAMVVLNIVPKRREGFRSSDFESCSRDLNMTQSEKGVFTRYRRKQGRNVAEYHVAVADKDGAFCTVSKQKPFYIHDIVVYLNVPKVGNPIEVFDNMLEESRKLSTWLDGKLVDKQRRNLTTKMVRKFREQILEIEVAMQKDGLKPGDSISQKLF